MARLIENQISGSVLEKGIILDLMLIKINTNSDSGIRVTRLATNHHRKMKINNRKEARQAARRRQLNQPTRIIFPTSRD